MKKRSHSRLHNSTGNPASLLQREVFPPLSISPRSQTCHSLLLHFYTNYSDEQIHSSVRSMQGEETTVRDKKKKHTSSSMLKIYYSWPQKIVTEQQILSQGEEPSYSVWDLSLVISVWQICWTHSSKNWLICFFLYLAKQRLPSINLLVSNFAHLNTLWYPPSVGLHPACKSRW